MRTNAGSFLILHGWQNRRPRGHWQHWLAGELTAAGHQVEYPQLPEPDYPKPADWATAALAAAARLTGPERVVVCHSLGCLAWLHACSPTGVANRAASVLRTPRIAFRIVLVAPPSRTFLSKTVELSAFDPPVSARPVDAGTAAVRLVHSDNDPYCPVPEDVALPPIDDLREDLLPGQGHFDLAAGYGSWPEMLDWCEGRRTRLAPRRSADAELTKA